MTLEEQKMMTINLALGLANVVDGHKVTRAYFSDFDLPNGRDRFIRDAYMAGKPPISVVYDAMVSQGMDGEAIIDKLISLYFPHRLFRAGTYKDMSLCVGFIGMRGAGKSVGAVITASSDWLLRGLPVWSNIPIKIRVSYKGAEKIFQSMDIEREDLLDLTEGYRDGLILIDEINMEGMEATRASSGANLALSYQLQQIRKRKLSVIWSCQGFNWVDNRLRWQSDYVVACRDCYLENKCNPSGPGDKSIWHVHDLSGLSGNFDYQYEIRHRYIDDFKFMELLMWNRPWWNAYDTGELQGQENYIEEYRNSKTKKPTSVNVSGPMDGETFTVDELVDNLLFSDWDMIYCDTVWNGIALCDRSIQSKIGAAMTARGIKKARDTRGYYWYRNDYKPRRLKEV